MPRSTTLRHTAPTCFVPSCAKDFVGQAGKVAEMLLRKAERLRASPDQPLKLLVSGAPGIGKTSLVNLIARTLASPDWRRHCGTNVTWHTSPAPVF